MCFFVDSVTESDHLLVIVEDSKGCTACTTGQLVREVVGSEQDC